MNMPNLSIDPIISNGEVSTGNSTLPKIAFSDAPDSSPNFRSGFPANSLNETASSNSSNSSNSDLRITGLFGPEIKGEFAAIYGDGSVDINTGYTTISGGLSAYQTSGGSGGSQDYSQRPGTLDFLIGNSVPRTLRGRILRAFQWANCDDLLMDALRIKRKFTMAGFQVRCKPEEDSVFNALLSSGKDLVISGEAPTEFRISPEEGKRLQEQAKFQRMLNKIERKWELYSLVSQLIHDWNVSDSMILFWRLEVPTAAASDSSLPPVTLPDSTPSGRDELIPGLLQLCALNPGLVNWSDSLGRNDLHVYIPGELIKLIQETRNKNPNGQDREQAFQRLVDNGVHRKYIEAVLAGKDQVQLRNADGEYWLIKTEGRRYSGLADPSMKTIFVPLESRKILTEGDFNAHYMMKHFLFHVTMGESIDSGPLAGQRTNWAKPKEITDFMAVITKPVKSYRVVTNHTIKFHYIFPPKEMFDAEKYKKPEERILNWVGITVSVLSGGGSNYSGGFIGIKKISADIVDSRRSAGWLVTEFFDHETIRNALKPPEDSIVVGVFDENILKEPKQLLEELKFMIDKGLGDPRIASQELGREPDSIRLSKLQSLADNQQTGVYRPVYIPVFGGGGGFGQDKGRPANATTTQSEGTRTQSPGAGI